MSPDFNSLLIISVSQELQGQNGGIQPAVSEQQAVQTLAGEHIQ